MFSCTTSAALIYTRGATVEAYVSISSWHPHCTKTQPDMQVIIIIIIIKQIIKRNIAYGPLYALCRQK